MVRVKKANPLINNWQFVSDVVMVSVMSLQYHFNTILTIT